MTVAMEVSWGACSDTGVRRAANEDAYLAGTPVFLVADGMGGHVGGAEASARALDGFRELVGAHATDVDTVRAAFARAVARVDEIPRGTTAPGTTLSGVIVCEERGVPHWLVLNIGDSRTYRFAAGALEQVSIDHSAVQSLVDDGVLSIAEAERHPHRHVITRAVGAGSSGQPDYWLFPVGHHDRILVCSDGLSKEVPAEVISAILAVEDTASAAAARLVREALERGGRDNVTVVVVDARLDTRAGDVDDIDEDTVPRSNPAEEAHRVEL
ncbi:PP2C family protein-serine/threonine phosphatase [Microbacterium trichothecenolyticum]|uniref:Serine/threonine protein phosphatase PrpC n=1 Tax=Microbacterium trichothecenolyticum TaxID=69370 RepID=A0ABU0U0F9_MICTR|nr:protein phosphatase 2C domain-containing protein [Microbacterium trichothecenolyticum]MDQ1124712.1 serine/threonine protein phosphatase PrpC [Microbacterium trichothecenolyticum]